MAELQAAMSPDEFEAWRAFYVLWPFDDLHRFHRPAALVAASLGGGDVQKNIDFLQPQPQSAPRLKPVQIIRTPKE